MTPNHALQRTRRGRRACNRRVPCTGSLSLGRSAHIITKASPPFYRSLTTTVPKTATVPQ